MREDRINLMEEYVIRNGVVSMEELAEQFQISINTVRRDVKQLLTRRTLVKVYGGVAVRERQDTQPVLPFAIRIEKNRKAKETIGRLASELVQDGDSIFLDSGSTTPQILPHLADKTGVTVLTHSLSVLTEASKYRNLRVIAFGGIFNPDTASYVDIETMASLSRFTIDKVFVAATGVSLENGLTNTTFLEAEIKRMIVKRAKKLILLADSSKFDYSSIITFCDFNNLSCVVTEKRPPAHFVEAMEANQIALYCEKD